MRRNIRPLFWVEVGLAAITGLLGAHHSNISGLD